MEAYAPKYWQTNAGQRYEEKQSIKKTHFYLFSLLFVDRGLARERRTRSQCTCELAQMPKSIFVLHPADNLTKTKIAVFFELRRLLPAACSSMLTALIPMVNNIK